MRKLITILFIAAIIVAAWWWESPVRAIKDLRDAVAVRDVSAIEQEVDLAALRASLKQELGDAVSAPAGSNPLAGKSTRADISASVDELLTPEGLHVALAAEPRSELLAEIGAIIGTVTSPEAAEADWAIERGFQQFSVRRKTADGKEMATLHFTRKGLGWQLTALELPKSAKVPKSAQ